MAAKIPKLPGYDFSSESMGTDVRSKREALKNMIGQAKLMEIIDAAYDNADSCPNCAELKAWWESNGPTLPTQPQGAKKRVR